MISPSHRARLSVLSSLAIVGCHGSHGRLCLLMGGCGVGLHVSLSVAVILFLFELVFNTS